MKKLIGILIISQTVLFGLLLNQLNQISHSIIQAGAYVVAKEGTMAWGGNLPTPYFVLLGALIILGAVLVFTEDKKTKK
ncbi:hypothetical protein [Exiguobacterium sp. s152]|uniref:hypothetical protein n=1 Tax=Exiguobacterium sp. s152 TaxID=2751226 RepID=UPI002036CBFB|nr:hypothetical protein [Exiguobacterium sp. s152]